MTLEEIFKAQKTVIANTGERDLVLLISHETWMAFRRDMSRDELMPYTNFTSRPPQVMGMRVEVTRDTGDWEVISEAALAKRMFPLFSQNGEE